LFNPGLARLLRPGAWDACLVYGWAYASCWLAIAAARRSGTAVLLGTDATTLEPQSGGSWKVPLKRRLLPRILKLADMVVVPSSSAGSLVRSLGVNDGRVVLTPYVVDNDRFAAAAAATDRAAVRRGWGVPPEAAVALFCAKFIERKRPLDVVRAFAAAPTDSYLVMVGAGPLDEAVRREARAAGVAERVRLPGLVPYAELPAVYASADLLVMASSHEPWGLPVNEAMACGRPVIASDRVGAAGDLVEEGVTGHVYRAGDVALLSALLAALLADRDRAASMGRAALLRMKTWGPADNAEAVARAAHAAVARRRRPA
jgi:glycosyltransferase involved in cell wall biosynthesis